MNADLDALKRQGFFLLPDLYFQEEVDSIKDAVGNLFEPSAEESEFNLGPSQSIRSQKGVVYAARNLHEFFPGFDSIWMRPRICQVISQILGKEFGLVRALYFDKHPDRTWSLPWHRDMTIAVEDNSVSSEGFGKPTTKAGIPHVEAPEWLLKKMITLRLHLDPVDNDNGPLIVRAGDFCNDDDDSTEFQDVAIHCDPGTVLAMRPLLLHSSPSSAEQTRAHRRIIHMEFCSQSTLPDGLLWRTFQKPVLD